MGKDNFISCIVSFSSLSFYIQRYERTNENQKNQKKISISSSTSSRFFVLTIAQHQYHKRQKSIENNFHFL